MFGRLTKVHIPFLSPLVGLLNSYCTGPSFYVQGSFIRGDTRSISCQLDSLCFRMIRHRVKKFWNSLFSWGFFKFFSHLPTQVLYLLCSLQHHPLIVRSKRVWLFRRRTIERVRELEPVWFCQWNSYPVFYTRYQYLIVVIFPDPFDVSDRNKMSTFQSKIHTRLL